MWYLMIGVAVLLMAWLLMLPKGYAVVRRQTIKVSPQVVFDFVREFKTWERWSPWDIHEKDLKLSYHNSTEVGGWYAWNGKIVGEGKMTHVTIDSPKRMEMKLEFFRPFKSVSTVRFEFEALTDQHTQVIWTMESGLPIFLRPMGKKLERMVGQDFELGLAFLLGQLDPTAEHPKLSFEGIVTRTDTEVMVEHFEGNIQQLPIAMKEVYPRLAQRLGEKINGKPLALYPKVSMKTGQTHCDMAYPVNVKGDKTLAGGRYLHVRFNGNYLFLPLAWNAAMNNVRMAKLGFDYKRPPFEIYSVTPDQVASSNDWVTDIYVPVKK